MKGSPGVPNTPNEHYVMTAISREVISQMRQITDGTQVCIVSTSYVGLPGGGGQHLCPQPALLKIRLDGDRLMEVKVKQGGIEVLVSLVGRSLRDGMIRCLINRPRGYAVELVIDLDANLRSRQMSQFAEERKQAEAEKRWHPMWYLHHVFN